jgi:hypothetical protein
MTFVKLNSASVTIAKSVMYNNYNIVPREMSTVVKGRSCNIRIVIRKVLKARPIAHPDPCSLRFDSHQRHGNQSLNFDGYLLTRYELMMINIS